MSKLKPKAEENIRFERFESVDEVERKSKVSS